MVLGGLVVHLMDLDDLVDDMRLDHIYTRESAARPTVSSRRYRILTSVDHRHDHLLDVMMEVLASLDGHDLMSLLAFHMLCM